MTRAPVDPMSRSTEDGERAHLVWSKGGTADVIETKDDAIVLRSTISAPPGARLEAKHGERTVKVKSHGSHKEEDGTFTIKGRLIDANRELRDLLAALVG